MSKKIVKMSIFGANEGLQLEALKDDVMTEKQGLRNTVPDDSKDVRTALNSRENSKRNNSTSDSESGA